MGWKAYHDARKAREEFQRVFISTGGDRNAALAAVGRTAQALYKWRQRYPDFSAWYDAACAEFRDGAAVAGENRSGPASRDWGSGFAEFRRAFLGHDSPWFHVLAIDAIEAAEPGSVTLLLWPPEHGKTALLEDADLYWVCNDPSVRISVGSERIDHSKKILGYVRDTLDHSAPGRAPLRERFGPFAPPKGVRHNQPWGSAYFNVYKKPRGQDRDYTMQALGITSSIIGTRCDVLQCDDLQGRKSINRTDEIMEVFRQDWLSRPGPAGKTFILANRVGEGDIYETLMESEILDHLIIVRADQNPDPDQTWAWPQRYSERDYDIMRRNAGEVAWERNYLQIGNPSATAVFTKEMWASCRTELRRRDDDPPRHPSGDDAHVVLSIDPSFKRSVVAAFAWEPTRMRWLDYWAKRDLTAWEQLFAVIEELCVRYSTIDRCCVRKVIVETKAFQRGLITDDRMLELQRRFGFDIVPQETGGEKLDDEIGVPQLAQAMRRGEIEIPDGTDDDRAHFDQARDEFCRWRPGARGNKLVQDIVMAAWFQHHHWRRERRVLRASPSSFRTAGLRSSRPQAGLVRR